MFDRIRNRIFTPRRRVRALGPAAASSRPAHELGPARFCIFSLGITTAAFGVAITASVFTLALRGTSAAAQVADSALPASIAVKVSSAPTDLELEALAGEAAALVETASPPLPASDVTQNPAFAAPRSLDFGSLSLAAKPSTLPHPAFAAPPDGVRIQALGLASGPSPQPSAPRPQAPISVPAPTEAPTQVPAAVAPPLVIATPQPLVVHATEDVAGVRRIRDVNVTFYDCMDQGFCGRMANGRKVYEGAAACSYDLPLGTRFYIVDDPTNRVYQCDDRGLLSRTWVDIFWYDPRDGWRWQDAVGRYGTIVIVEWGGE